MTLAHSTAGGRPAAGEPLRCEVDPRTGVNVWCLAADADRHVGSTYFYLPSMSADERYLVVAVGDPDQPPKEQPWRVGRVDLQTGATTLLIDEHAGLWRDVADDGESAPPPLGGRWPQVHPNGRELVAVAANRIVALSLDTLEPRLVALGPADGEVELAGDLRFVDERTFLLNCRHARGEKGVAVGRDDGSSAVEAFRWCDERDVFCHLQSVPPAGPEDEVRCTAAMLPDHQNKFRESDGKRARCWFFNLTRFEARPFLIMPPGERATHEYWVRTDAGPRLFYHRKRCATWTPNRIESVDVAGGDRRVHYASDDRPMGHSSVSPDGRWLVTDVEDAEAGELIRIDLHTGASTVLCYPGASWASNEVGHVHPSFSPSGRWVLFTSDRTGRAAAYAVPVEPERDEGAPPGGTA